MSVQGTTLKWKKVKDKNLHNVCLVPDDSEMCTPRFTTELADTSLRDGECLFLKSLVKGVPEPQVTWFKNGSPLSSSEVVDLKYKNSTATLTINEVYPEDEGEYCCKAVNSLGVAETRCKLTVLRKYSS